MRDRISVTISLISRAAPDRWRRADATVGDFRLASPSMSDGVHRCLQGYNQGMNTLKLFVFSNAIFDYVDVWAASDEEAKALLRNHHDPQIQQLADDGSLHRYISIPEKPGVGSYARLPVYPKLDT